MTVDFKATGEVLESLKPDLRLLLPTITAEWRAYTREKFRADALAAVTVTLVSIPQVLGFSLLLGLPPMMVLTCTIVGAFVAALFFSSKLMIFGATNSSALLIASAIHRFDDTAFSPAELAVALALMVGLLQVAAGLFRFGAITQFVSRSVIIAYATAIGVLLALHQAHNLSGLIADRGEPLVATLLDAVRRLPRGEGHVPSMALAAASMLTFYLIRRLRPRWPDLLIGLVAFTLLLWLVPGLGDLGIRTLGEQGALDGALPRFQGVPFSAGDLSVLGALFSTAVAVAVLGMLEAVSLAKNLSFTHGEKIDSNREIAAMGLGNLANAVFATVPGSSSFVRSAVNVQAGARTQFAALFIAGLTPLVLLLLSGLINHLPVPTLAASLVLVGFRMIGLDQIRMACRSTGSDATVFFVTLGGALLLPLDTAIYVGIFLSIALALRKASQPSLVEYGFDAGGQLSELRDPVGRPHPRISIIHIEGELFFGAADLFQDQVRRRVEAEDLRAVILRLKNARHLDASAVFALSGLHTYLKQTGRHLLVSGIHGDALAVLRRSGLLERIGRDNVFPAEENYALATKKALVRAQTLLGTREADIKLYYSDPQRASVAGRAQPGSGAA